MLHPDELRFVGEPPSPHDIERLDQHRRRRPEEQHRVGRRRHLQRLDRVERHCRIVVVRRPVHSGLAAVGLEPPGRVGIKHAIDLSPELGCDGDRLRGELALTGDAALPFPPCSNRRLLKLGRDLASGEVIVELLVVELGQLVDCHPRCWQPGRIRPDPKSLILRDYDETLSRVALERQVELFEPTGWIGFRRNQQIADAEDAVDRLAPCLGDLRRPPRG